MKQNISYDKQISVYFKRNQLSPNFKKQQPANNPYGHNFDKSSDIVQTKKQPADYLQTNRQREEFILALEKQLKGAELEQKKIQSEILKSQLEFQTVKLHNLQKRHQYEEEKQQEEQQHQMDMDAWLNQVQKFNGLPQAGIDSLLVMEYEASPFDSDICLSCYKEMKTGDMAKYLPCAHYFHDKCIDKHLKISKVCPACMEEVVV